MLWLNLGWSLGVMVKSPAALLIPRANLISSKAISGISGEGSGRLFEKVKTVVLTLGICVGSNVRILPMKLGKAQMQNLGCSCSLGGMTVPVIIA